ncbi:meiosis expressed gene 1 protein homolog [Branchiostoma floridae]|uniref:Meiosis expressed gene 1 protein homolog n=1 Tax=Branchiostoma floridae TaxID=7739 RepID=A0A9J7L6R9_BRAFL|nr:meiosis expressed gene 1 protein homolog [Branchiostoma floridae]XP_035677007.1 meiosis expressed gene 1 protein homolog [Branchiostoma floridae]
MAAAVTASMQPKSMTRAKKWDEVVENAYRFQLAGYRDEEEYRSVKKVDSAEKWDNGFVKKLQRKDGCFYYYNKARECSDKDVPKTKLYNY